MDPLAEQFVGWTPYHYVHNNPINLIDPTGMSAEVRDGGEDHWEIKNGKAHLIDTKGDDIFIRNEGEKDFKKLSEFDFTNKTKAAQNIIDYYSKEYPLASSDEGGFQVKANYFSSKENAESYGYGSTLMGLDYPTVDKGGWFRDDKVKLRLTMPLIEGKFSWMLNNKFNMRNTIGHEYKHYKDFLQLRTYFNYGFNFNTVIGNDFFSRGNLEIRAINEQMSLPSWEHTTDVYKQHTNNYLNKFKKQ